MNITFLYPYLRCFKKCHQWFWTAKFTSPLCLWFSLIPEIWCSISNWPKPVLLLLFYTKPTKCSTSALSLILSLCFWWPGCSEQGISFSLINPLFGPLPSWGFRVPILYSCALPSQPSLPGTPSGLFLLLTLISALENLKPNCVWLISIHYIPNCFNFHFIFIVIIQGHELSRGENVRIAAWSCLAPAAVERDS